jgi:hypothetical protein
MGSYPRNILAAVTFIIFMAPITLSAMDIDLKALKGPLATVYHPESLRHDASSVQDLYGEAQKEASSQLGLSIDYKPHIILVPDNSLFQKAAGSRHVSAYASSEKGMIVLDYTQVLKKPFTLKSTLKHEMVHLVLGRNIAGHIPKWLNEGVAQFITDNPAELLLSRNGNTLNGAALSGRLLPLDSIKSVFPQDRKGMILAYEQSLSIVRYLEREYGKGATIKILSSMANGKKLNDAVRLTTGNDLETIEIRWNDHLRTKASWLVYLSNHFYELIFIFGALLTLLGFARLVIRIRNYKDEEDEHYEY